MKTSSKKLEFKILGGAYGPYQFEGGAYGPYQFEGGAYGPYQLNFHSKESV
jgi:hypothetical protein